MSREEGHLVESEHVTKLKARFHNLDERQKTIIREIADEAFGGISMDPPTERRVGIARILLEIAEQEGHIDKDLVRSVCTHRTGKQYQNAGLALLDLSWRDAERVWFSLQQIYAGQALLEYNPHSNHFNIKETTNVR